MHSREEWEAILARAADGARMIFRSAHTEPAYLAAVDIGAAADRRPLLETLRFQRDLAARLQREDRVQTYAGFHIAACGRLTVPLAADARVLAALLRGMPREGTHAARLERFYGPQAHDYDTFRDGCFMAARSLIARLPVVRGARIVELGGGTGANRSASAPGSTASRARSSSISARRCSGSPARATRVRERPQRRSRRDDLAAPVPADRVCCPTR